MYVTTLRSQRSNFRSPPILTSRYTAGRPLPRPYLRSSTGGQEKISGYGLDQVDEPLDRAAVRFDSWNCSAAEESLRRRRRVSRSSPLRTIASSDELRDGPSAPHQLLASGRSPEVRVRFTDAAEDGRQRQPLCSARSTRLFCRRHSRTPVRRSSPRQNCSGT